MDAAWLKTQFSLHPDRSKADLARALGLEPPAVSKIIAGTRQIKAQEYLAMRKFFGLPADGARAAGGADGDSWVLPPLQTGLAEKEGGDDGDSPDSWVMPARLLARHTDAPPDKIRIFEVQGDAMAPDFTPGSHVLVDLTDTHPAPAGEFVVSDGHGPVLRQCEYVPHSSPPEIRFSALNRKYAPYTLPQARAQIIGRVIARLQWL